MVEKKEAKEEGSALVFFEKTLQNTSGFFKKSLQNFEGTRKEKYTPRGYPEKKVPIYYTTKKRGLSRGRREIFYFFTKRSEWEGERRKKLVITNKNDPVLKRNMLDLTRRDDRTAGRIFFLQGEEFFFHSPLFCPLRGTLFLFTKPHPL